jgi:hypothetical protein
MDTSIKSLKIAVKILALCGQNFKGREQFPRRAQGLQNSGESPATKKSLQTDDKYSIITE